ncbi:MAG: response regulator [Chitinophagales bacterium]
MKEKTSQIKLVIVDKDQFVAELLRNSLHQQYEINVLWISKGEYDLLSKLSEAEVLPDVLLLDLDMNTIDTAMRVRMQFPSIKIIIWSSNYDKSFIGELLKLGINAFLPKDIPLQELKEIIEIVVKTGNYIRGD